MKDWYTNGAVIVSWDFSHSAEKAILLVGKQTKGEVEVINAFQGRDAVEMFKNLTMRKPGGESNV